MKRLRVLDAENGRLKRMYAAVLTWLVFGMTGPGPDDGVVKTILILASDVVKCHDLLVELARPMPPDELAKARSTLEQVEAQYLLDRSTAEDDYFNAGASGLGVVSTEPAEALYSELVCMCGSVAGISLVA